jgi:hypothetical protein
MGNILFCKKCLENDLKSPTQSTNRQDLLFKKCTRATTCATCGAGTATLSEHPNSPPDFGWVRLARYLWCEGTICFQIQAIDY